MAYDPKHYSGLLCLLSLVALVCDGRCRWRRMMYCMHFRSRDSVQTYQLYCMFCGGFGSNCEHQQMECPKHFRLMWHERKNNPNRRNWESGFLAQLRQQTPLRDWPLRHFQKGGRPKARYTLSILAWCVCDHQELISSSSPRVLQV